jgi:hypothetical protein
MSIPTAITTALSSLQGQVAAAAPLASASQATKTALKLNAAALVASVQSQLTATSLLDTFVAPSDPSLIIAGVLQLEQAAADQSTLSLMRGAIGRATSNLDQL